MPYRCRECKGYFSVRKGTAATRTHRDLGISVPSAWHLMHRIREGFVREPGNEMGGPVEVDETYIGGKFCNMTKERVTKMREKYPGRGPVGKQILAGIKDRATNRVILEVLPDNRKRSTQPFVCRNVPPGTTVYTDDLKSYEGLPYPHGVVHHARGD